MLRFEAGGGMLNKMLKLGISTTAVLLGMLLSPPAAAENIFSVYTGTSATRNSDLPLSDRGAGIDLAVHDVHWDADPFKAAPYYGLRYTHFFEQRQDWGVALDFTHYKMVADTGRTVPLSGSWKGAAINTRARMDQYVQQFEISHGVNMLSINGMYRWRSPSAWQPYAGVGLAYYRPHAETNVDHRAHATGYDDSGFGYQLLGGVQYRFGIRWGAFAEIKFNSGTARLDIADGRASTRLRTFHLLAGVQYVF
jgi:lipid A oxidase